MENMSIDTLPVSDAEKSAAPAKAGVRRRTVARRPGLSIMAQGEPLLWLTGGSLAICLAMIIGLVVLVLIAGMTTFIPSPLVQVTLRDGTRYLGEVTREQEYELTRDMIESMPEPIAVAARERLGEAETAVAHRRLLRTGNFELTNSHFHWVSDFEVDPEAETDARWAVTVERVEWGRFYGYPHEFAVRHLREPSDREAELLEVIRFFESNQWRLSDPAEAEKLQTALQPLRDEYSRIQKEHIAEFLSAFKPTESKRIDVLTDGNQVVVLADLPADANVLEVHEVWSEPQNVWDQFNAWHGQVRERFHKRRRIEKHDIGHVNLRIENARLDVRQAEIDHAVYVLETANEMLTVQTEIDALEASLNQSRQIAGKVENSFAGSTQLVTFANSFLQSIRDEIDQQAEPPRMRLAELQAEVALAAAPVQASVQRYLDATRVSNSETAELVATIDGLKERNSLYELRMKTVDDSDKTLKLADIVRAYPANQLSSVRAAGIYFSRWREFLLDDPREANSEGGVFPAILGTVVMTLIMSLVVVPFGVLAALYLREYAKAGPIVSAVRISINNLAGVPSIVFGVFGLGFFCYVVGAYIDGGPRNANLPVWPKWSWFGALAVLAVAAFLAFLLSMYTISKQSITGAPRRSRYASYTAVSLWLLCAGLFVVVIATTPLFGGFYEANLPNPKFGKSGLLWSSLTLALLTLPVVIVATEEALSSVPNSLREGSYACGAGKWQTIRRIVLPHAMPGIMTGMILAMARGAGEVAPLMLVGAVKLAPELPLDLTAPFLHADRSFMHLGFHIYDLGFQSQNSEAAKPMVFTTTLLLILLIAALNLAAVWLRSKLRKQFTSSAF